MDFGFFRGDLRQQQQRAFEGFSQTSSSSSSSNGFHFSGDRTNPFQKTPYHHHNPNTTASMADFDLGLSQNFSKMGISDDKETTFTGFHQFLNNSVHSGSRNLHGFSRLDQAREGLLQSFHGEPSMSCGYGEFQDLRPRREGFLQSFHGESSMSSYLRDERLRLLDLQDYPNPNQNHNPSFNHRGFMSSLHNRDYPLEHIHQQQIRRENHPLIPQKSQTFPPFSAMGGTSRDLEASVESMKQKNNPLLKEDLPLPPLDLASLVDIFGSVYLTAKDQMGCRFLQKFVEEEGSFVDVMIIYKEVINHVTELAMDPFGNYFIQKLLQICNEEQRTQILVKLTSKPKLLVKISLNTYGTRVAQKLIETVSTEEQISLIKSALKPGFLSLVKDLNGNHVLLTCLKSFVPNDNKFIIEAATKFCAELATHRHGCCVLQRCISYSDEEHRDKLVAEISRNALHLAQDPFGNYVVQYIIEKKMEGVNVMFHLKGNYVKLATQKFGSHVVEKCLRNYPESRSQIVRELVSVPNFGYLLQDPYANYVIQSALSVTKGLVRATMVEKIRRCENLKMSPYCKKIFSKSLLKKK